MDPNQRASDADRQHVVEALQRHTGDGRLSLDEFAARTDATYRAITYADLASITADLPVEPVRRLPRTPVAVALVVAVVFAVLLVVGVAQVASLVHMDTMMATMGLGMGGSCR